MRKPFLPIVIVFLVAAITLIAGRFFFPSTIKSFDALAVGNVILLVAAFFSFRFYQKAIGNDNTMVFLRMVYSAMLLKMLLCIAAVLMYAFMSKPIDKLAILVFFGLYFVYTFAEIKIVLRLNKKKKNA
ncbi:MAG: hypothetical protein JST47_00435 [Bacteroidetes bacterium]|nr:hypothetical protein [Bacteroidota bacterium]MBS1972813.1 hypothetical protein [Bacteroidota bacterium]